MIGELLSLSLSISHAAETGSNAEAEWFTQPRQLTFEGRRSGEAYFSPDGQALIFQSEREPDNPFYQIYLLDLQTGDSHRVSPGNGKTTCAFFRPGSEEVLFASTHLDAEAPAKQKAELEFRASGKQRRYSWDYDEQMDIFSARRDGTQLTRLTRATGYDAEASYSPDGTKIVFTSLRDAYPAEGLSPEDRKRLETDPAYFGEIYLMNADGTNQKRLTSSPGYDGGPFFSPDGQRIVWRRFEVGGTIANIFSMNLEGGEVTQLTDFGCMSWAPFYHPSGKYLIFTSNKLGFSNFELFLVDTAGRHEPVRITHTDGFDGLPVFSPDGTQLCWTSARTADGASQLFLAKWNHTTALAKLDAAPERSASAPSAFAVAQKNAAPSATQMPAKPDGPAPEIRIDDLEAAVRYLASDDLEGRMSGTKGAERAATFLAGEFERAGLKPFPTMGEYFQEFGFNSGVRVVTNANRLVLTKEGNAAEPLLFDGEKDFRPLSFTASGEAEGEVVFAGYGLALPGKGSDGYDSYTGIDVTNKIVLVLRYAPEKVAPKRRQELNRYAGLRYKAMLARERGAKAILVVTGPASPNAGELAPLSFDSSLAESGIVAGSITARAADALLAATGQNLATLQAALDDENPHGLQHLAIPKTRVKVVAAVEHLRRGDRNVLGYLPPTPRTADQQYVLIGAHYDHLGRGETGAMLRQGEEGQIHPGADDNASGVAAVLELAAATVATARANPAQARRGFIFALWSGEELGLIGSSHFAGHSPVPLSHIVAYLNFDMVGRLRDNKLILQGVGSSMAWRKWIEKRNVAAGFNLALQDDPYLPTDVTALYPKQVPVLNFFTGAHDDYHRPTDRPDTLNYEGLERIVRFAQGLMTDLAVGSNRLEYAKVEPTSPAAGQRDNLRAYLGTIPDYATEVIGVKLSGVRTGSPAEKGGLQGGDVIVEFAGQQIKNIYDYTYALDAVKIGQPVAIVVLRGQDRKAFQVTPEARK
ncbi:MAG: M28 family peptidase [Verrucomicrobiota bacterium]